MRQAGMTVLLNTSTLKTKNNWFPLRTVVLIILKKLIHIDNDEVILVPEEHMSKSGRIRKSVDYKKLAGVSLAVTY